MIVTYFLREFFQAQSRQVDKNAHGETQLSDFQLKHILYPSVAFLPDITHARQLQ